MVTRGVRTTAGSKILDNFVPPYDCTAVTRMEAAGAVVLGKVNCDEFAMGSSTENSAYHPVRNPRDQTVLVSLAGPGVNILLALLAAAAFRRVAQSGGDVREVVLNLGFANVLLAAFNLIPIPPLDGSAVIERFLPRSWWPRYLQLRQYSMGILLILVLILPGVLSRVFNWAIDLWARLL